MDEDLFNKNSNSNFNEKFANIIIVIIISPIINRFQFGGTKIEKLHKMMRRTIQ